MPGKAQFSTVRHVNRRKTYKSPWRDRPIHNILHTPRRGLVPRRHLPFSFARVLDKPFTSNNNRGGSGEARPNPTPQPPNHPHQSNPQVPSQKNSQTEQIGEDPERSSETPSTVCLCTASRALVLLPRDPPGSPGTRLRGSY
jgi:hypothetical protein